MSTISTLVGHTVTLGTGGYTSPLTVTGGTNGGNISPQAAGATGIDIVTAGATVDNFGFINGGGGSYSAGDVGGHGGIGIYASVGGVVIDDSNVISGKSGGSSGATGRSGRGGQGGDGIDLTSGGTISITATGLVEAGGGGNGSGLGGPGGSGIAFSGAGLITNAGTIEAGPGGSAGSAGTKGGGGTGVALSGGGTLINTGTIIGGGTGVIGTGGAGGPGVSLDGGTLINAGHISQYAGTTADAVRFGNVASTLIVETGAVFTGTIVATTTAADVLEVSGAGATITGIGTEFTDFSALSFGSGGSLTLEGSTTGLASGATIDNLVFGDTLVLDGFEAATETYVTNTGLELTDAGGAQATLDITGPYATSSFIETVSGSATTISVHCYGRGTRIETPEGDIAIEDLRIGDVVITAAGAARPIIWIGTRQFDPSFVGRNPNILPIRICRDALADGIPRRDLLVSPEHAMLIDSVLVAAKHLVNGVSIRQEDPGSIIEYFHLELATHDAILAEGAASETYIEDGDRGMFHNAPAQRIQPPPPVRYCAPRLDHGLRLEAIRAGIDHRAGLRSVTTPDPGLHLLADGRVIPPCDARDGAFVFSLQAAVRDIVLASRLADQPGADRRCLGVAVMSITIDGTPIDLATLAEPGWHQPERDDERLWRWTNSAATLPAVGRACRIEITARPAPHYRTHHGAGSAPVIEPPALAA